MGVVLAYRGSGVINFAQGAMAMWVAFVYSELRTTGDYVFPLIGVPARFDLGESVAFLPAFLLGLGSAVLLGVLLHFLVFRPLRHAPSLAKVVASVGVALVLQALVVLKFGTANRTVAPILPAEPLRIFGLVIPRDRLFLALIMAGVAVVLWVLYRFTKFGLSTRAAAENEKGVTVLGYSAASLALMNWVLAAVLAGLVAMLIAPITGVDPVNMTLLIVPALGAALVGRFTSFGTTLATALAIGMVQALIIKFQVTFDWIPEFAKVGVKEGVPFIVIIVVLVTIGQYLPTRGTIITRRLPFSGRPRRVGSTAIVAFAMAMAAIFVLQGTFRLAFTTSLLAAIVTLSIVLLTGYVGQISLAQAAFAGTAGFALSKFADSLHVPFPIAPILAAGVAMVVGLLVGLPALRVRGVQLAVVTMAAAVAIEEFAFKNRKFTGGFEGSHIPQPSFFGLDLGARGAEGPRVQFGILVLVVLIALAVAVANLRRAGTGRRMLAVRANERAAAAAGINVASMKLFAFGLSAFIAGLGGALIGYQRGQLSFSSFGVMVSLSLLAITYLGGISGISGAMIGGSLAGGGIVFHSLDRWIGFGRWELLISGAGLILTAILNPEGISGAVQFTYRQLKQMLSGKTEPGLPAVEEFAGDADA